ncbi:monocarboxylate transporter 3 isoform X2 [Strongylocentrotus purpuratus]|nr:monocarboxylate transporter 3 isoform X2 [Strongylocentrotus purpuratus]
MGSVASSGAIIMSAFTTSALWFGVAMFLTGLFSAPMNQISHAVLHRYFGVKFGFVNSVCLLGCLVGGMIFPPITYSLLEEYGIEGALICLGALYLNCVPIAVTFRNPSDSRNKSSVEYVRDKELEAGIPMEVAHPSSEYEGNCETKLSQSEENTDPLMVKHQVEATELRQNIEPKYGRVTRFLWISLNLRVLVNEKAFTILFLPCKYLIEVVYVAWILFVVSFAMAKDLPEALATYLPIAGSVGGFFNQGLVTILLHYRPFWGAPIFIVNMSSVALAFFLYPVSSSFVHLLVCSFFVGGGIFGGFPATYSVLVTYVSAENFDSMLSVKFFVTGVGVVSSGYMAGTLYDVSGSFDDVFMMMGGMSVAAVLLTVALVICKRTRRKQNGAIKVK